MQERQRETGLCEDVIETGTNKFLRATKFMNFAAMIHYIPKGFGTYKQYDINFLKKRGTCDVRNQILYLLIYMSCL